MPNLSHLDKTDKIAARCPSDWKKEVQKAAIDRGESLEEIVLIAVSRYLKIPLPQATSSDAA